MLHAKIIGPDEGLSQADKNRHQAMEAIVLEIKKLRARYDMGCERGWAQYRINAVWEEIQKAERKYNELMQS